MSTDANDATKQYTEFVQQSQQAVLSAVETWTKAVQDAFSSVPSTASEFDAAGSVDKIYDFTEKVLEMQRDFTKKLIASSTEAAEKAKATVTEAAEKYGQPAS
jgi:enoyl-CoA hydratase/carnithine racemase